MLLSFRTAHKMKFPADLVTFTEEILNETLHFLCSFGTMQQQFFSILNIHTINRQLLESLILYQVP